MFSNVADGFHNEHILAVTSDVKAFKSNGHGMPPEIMGPGETALYVDDVDAAEEWYGAVLDLDTVFGGDHYRFLDLNGTGHSRQYLILFDPDYTMDQDDTPAHGTTDSIHLALDVALDDLDDWRDHLSDCNVTIEAEKQRNGDHSLYFRDPYDNSLELYGRTVDHG